MFTIDTAGPRWRHLAAVGLAVPLSFALAGTASAAAPQSVADISIDVSCFGIEVASDKDISNVKVTFADGTSEEIALTGLAFSRTFDKQIASATAKSGTQEVGGTATGCTTTPTTVEDDEDEDAPVEDQQLPDTAGGTATITITVDCRTVSVVSDKDISNVKVTFADGTRQEIEGLSGLTFERTFDKDIDAATSKSATTEVRDEAEGCAAAAPVVTTTPVVVATPVCPTGAVTGPVMDGCQTPVVPVTGQPAPLPAVGGGTSTLVPAETPVEAAPVVAEETPDQSTVGTPVAGQPARQAATLGAAGAVTGAPAQTPTIVAAQGAVAPTVLAAAAPATLPFTGADTDALLPLGSVLVMAGGGAMLVGRRQRTAKHVRTAKHARLA